MISRLGILVQDSVCVLSEYLQPKQRAMKMKTASQEMLSSTGRMRLPDREATRPAITVRLMATPLQEKSQGHGHFSCQKLTVPYSKARFWAKSEPQD